MKMLKPTLLGAFFAILSNAAFASSVCPTVDEIKQVHFTNAKQNRYEVWFADAVPFESHGIQWKVQLTFNSPVRTMAEAIKDADLVLQNIEIVGPGAYGPANNVLDPTNPTYVCRYMTSEPYTYVTTIPVIAD